MSNKKPCPTIDLSELSAAQAEKVIRELPASVGYVLVGYRESCHPHLVTSSWFDPVWNRQSFMLMSDVPMVSGKWSLGEEK